MFGDIIQPTHLIFILVVALVVLGPKRLPEVGRSLGKGIRDFRGALSGLEEDTGDLRSTFTSPLEAVTRAPVTPATTVPEPATSGASASPEDTAGSPEAEAEATSERDADVEPAADAVATVVMSTPSPAPQEVPLDTGGLATEPADPAAAAEPTEAVEAVAAPAEPRATGSEPA